MKREALGTLLMDLFDFYGNAFPYETSYISASEGKVLPKESKGWKNEKCPGAFSIECLIDPCKCIYHYTGPNSTHHVYVVACSERRRQVGTEGKAHPASVPAGIRDAAEVRVDSRP